MMAYWLRVLGALALLKAAGTVMKSAENVLRTNMTTKEGDVLVTVTNPVNGKSVTAEAEIIDVPVEAQYPGSPAVEDALTDNPDDTDPGAL